jgi:hypothetical protein
MNLTDLPDDDTGQAIRRWALEGSDLSKPMKVDFFVDVPDEACALRLSKDPDINQFDVSIEQDDQTGRWTCYCAKTMVASYAAVTEVEALLAKVAQRYGSKYDGFGSFGNA